MLSIRHDHIAQLLIALDQHKCDWIFYILLQWPACLTKNWYVLPHNLTQSVCSCTSSIYKPSLTKCVPLWNIWQSKCFLNFYVTFALTQLIWLLSKFCGSFHLFSDSILVYHGQLQIYIVVHIKWWYHVISVMAKFRKDIYEMTWCCHLTTHPNVIISLGLYNLMTWWLYRWMDG